MGAGRIVTSHGVNGDRSMPAMTTTTHKPPRLYTYVPSPIGRLLLCGDEARLTGLYTLPAAENRELLDGRRRASAPFVHVRDQLEAYFAGELLEFDVTLDLDEATPFRRSVWTALLEIPYGETVSYGELARRLALPSAARAVGAANGRNPISIIIPCHRVIGSSGDLTGYAGGLERKRYLLRHEAEVRPGPRPRDPAVAQRAGDAGAEQRRRARIVLRPPALR
jgi:methylated-DNA-[protein]-cysteine S-methyltransferase